MIGGLVDQPHKTPLKVSEGYASKSTPDGSRRRDDPRVPLTHQPD